MPHPPRNMHPKLESSSGTMIGQLLEATKRLVTQNVVATTRVQLIAKDLAPEVGRSVKSSFAPTRKQWKGGSSQRRKFDEKAWSSSSRSDNRGIVQRQQGRVFTLTKEGVGKDDATVVACTITLNDLNAFVLFDLGSTHSFVCSQFAAKLAKKPISLDCDLYVVTPLGASMSKLTVNSPPCHIITLTDSVMAGTHDWTVHVLSLNVKWSYLLCEGTICKTKFEVGQEDFNQIQGRGRRKRAGYLPVAGGKFLFCIFKALSGVLAKQGPKAWHVRVTFGYGFGVNCESGNS
ncbi:hypothetical protein FNV43_RR11102 [Rhamnella rubrinervis]|uniref:Uncharacterized protein n=1 Tax=Rhamnella rubrinervis TaxID=2594499 RepID=A0A8K0MHJ2_9ROSA|nr:hypothetical protein FNV43_RR11102 [Rhamnella rubrinervis]